MGVDEVDVLEAQALERGVDALDNVLAREADVVDLVVAKGAAPVDLSRRCRPVLAVPKTKGQLGGRECWGGVQRVLGRCADLPWWR